MTPICTSFSTSCSSDAAVHSELDEAAGAVISSSARSFAICCEDPNQSLNSRYHSRRTDLHILCNLDPHIPYILRLQHLHQIHR